MNYYRVLVIDDEAEVRQGIIKCVPWDQCGFEVMGEADNGEDAIEMLLENKADLVITDIKMPYMNGLEFCKRLSEISPTTKVIIITGFDDFEYAKQAIALNVLQYIVKPVNLGEMKEILLNVKKAMDAEGESIRNVEFLRQHYITSLPILKESFLIGLITGRQDEAKAKRLSETYGMGFDKKYKIVYCIKIDFSDHLSDVESSEFRVRRIHDEISSKYMTSYSFMYLDNVVCIACFDQETDTNRLMVFMNELKETAQKFFGLKFNVGVGYLCKSLSELHRSYRGAIAALDYRMLVDDGKPIVIDDYEPYSNIEIRFDERSEAELLSAIRSADEGAVEEVLSHLLERCQSAKIPYQKYQIYLLEIINKLMSLTLSFKIDDREIFGENFNPYEKVASFESKRQLEQWLAASCKKIAVKIKKEFQKNAARFVDMAKQYAAQHYMETDLSVEAMCNEMHISAAYFSSIFKKDMGKTFINYITELRLNESKRMLMETDLKTYLIAEKAGFADANYFSFVFKKHFGVSPTKFRSGQFG